MTHDHRLEQRLDAFAARFDRAGSGARLLCLGCTAVGRCQLGIDAVHLVGDTGVRADVVAPDHFEGGLGVTHGGWIAASLTEVLGQLVGLRGRIAVSSELSVRFRRPVPIGHELVILGEVVTHDADRWVLTAELRLRDGTDVLADAVGTWIERTTEHYVRHQEWLADRD